MILFRTMVFGVLMIMTYLLEWIMLNAFRVHYSIYIMDFFIYYVLCFGEILAVALVITVR